MKIWNIACQANFIEKKTDFWSLRKAKDEKFRGLKLFKSWNFEKLFTRMDWKNYFQSQKMMEWGVTYDMRVASEPYNRMYTCVGLG